MCNQKELKAIYEISSNSFTQPIEWANNNFGDSNTHTLEGEEAAIPWGGNETKGKTIATKPPAARPSIDRRDSRTTEATFSSSAKSSLCIFRTDDVEKEEILAVVDGTTNALTPILMPDDIAQQRASILVPLMLLMMNPGLLTNDKKRRNRSFDQLLLIHNICN